MVDRPLADEDAQWVAACQAGDERAMQQLYAKHHRRLFALALRLTGSRGDAEDVVQEAFLRAWKALPKFRGDSRFGTWIYRITLNLCRDMYKRRKPTEPEVEGEVAPATGDGIVRRRLNTALESLSAGYREVLVLHDVMELRHPEIAEIMGVEVGTSKSQLHKARAKMRALLTAA